MVLRLLSLALALTGVATQEPPFAIVGPMASLMPEGRTASAPSGGLPLSVVLREGGKAIEGSAYDLKVPGTGQTVHVALEGLSYANGQLTGKATVSDPNGSAIEGLRLDVIGASESYRGKDAQGKDAILVRGQAASISSPILFGDLRPGESEGSQDLAISGLKFAPETQSVDVHLVLSGLVLTNVFDLDGVSPGGLVAVDGRGRLYMSDTGQNRVARCDADGKNVVTAAKLPDQGLTVAVEPKSGEIAATCGNNQKIYLFTPGGEDKDPITDAQGLDNYAEKIRYDSAGLLWALVGGKLVKFGPDHKILQTISKAGDYDFDSDSPFEVAADGTIYALISDSMFRITPDGKTAKRIASGPGVKPAQLMHPKAIRTTPWGTVLVNETSDDETKEPVRISEFDRDGRLVRVFGRGGKMANSDPDQVNEGQPYQPSDIVVGPDGKIYVSGAAGGKGGVHMLVFTRF